MGSPRTCAPKLLDREVGKLEVMGGDGKKEFTQLKHRRCYEAPQQRLETSIAQVGTEVDVADRAREAK